MNEEQLLAEAGIKPTSSRVMVLRALDQASRPLSMQEIGDVLDTVDKSVISRTLALFREHHLVHSLEDGSESVRYEVCTCHDDDMDGDAHVHFHCMKCGVTYCLEGLNPPEVELPEGFESHFVNYMIKGICSKCSKH